MEQKLHECCKYKKITVITDPENPELDLMEQASSHGEVIHSSKCSDGFVLLVLLPENMD